MILLLLVVIYKFLPEGLHFKGLLNSYMIFSFIVFDFFQKQAQSPS